MEKGVFSKSLYLISIVLLFFAFSISTVAWTTPPEEVSTTIHTEITETTPPDDSVIDASDGYWMYKIRGSGLDQPIWTKSTDLGLVTLNTPGDTVDLDEIYGDFDEVFNEAFGSGFYGDIMAIRYVIDPRPSMFIVDALNLDLASDGTYSSHGGKAGDDLNAFYESFEGFTSGGESDDCLKCPFIDDLESCFRVDPLDPDKFDVSCIELNLLARSDCSDMADQSQQFCEGIEGYEPNEDAGNVFSIGVPGFGGCTLSTPQQAVLDSAGLSGLAVPPSGTTEEEGESVPVLPARDWYIAGENDDYFGPAFTPIPDKETIGRCCGNDPEDIGAVANTTNDYMCWNDTSIPVGSFKWLSAKESTIMFKVWSFNRMGEEFDTVSNGNSWFVCNTGDGLSDIYSEVTTNEDNAWQSGMLLNEYEILPFPTASLAQNTEALGLPGGGEGDGVLISGDNTGTSAENALDDIIDEEVFSSTEYEVTGTSAITACDKDGDGYDGAWTSDTSVDPPDVGENIMDPESGYMEEADAVQDTLAVCENPRQPFDCDDYILDDADDYGGLEDMARLRHPGRIDYCIDGVDYNLDCDEETDCIKDPTAEVDKAALFANPEASLIAPRFICHNADDRGEFAECCSWDTEFCYNPLKARRTGSAIHTLREFGRYGGEIPEGAEKTNFVLRYGVNIPPERDSIDDVDPDAVYMMALQSSNNDLDIKEWNDYKNLEFYIWMTANYEVELWIGDLIDIPDVNKNDIDSYVFPFKAKITDYVVNEPGLRKWLHVVIPVDDIYRQNDDFSPEVMIFASNVRRLMQLDTTVNVTVDGQERTFSNVIGVDKIFLRPNEADLPEGGDNYYCSGTWPPKWITDLDDDTKLDVSVLDSPQLGRDACESIPSYGWTGSMCCGDDTGKDTDSDTIGAATSKEFYADETAGCWAGNVIPENSRVMVVEYFVSYSSFTGMVTHSCTSHSCVYDLPGYKNVVVTNPNPETYDLSFVDLQEAITPIGVGGVTPTDSSYLRVDNVPMQVLYYDGEFIGCNAAGFIEELPQQTLSGEGSGDLITQLLLSPDENGQCSTAGQYFCDHANGSNLGWSDEALKAYPTIAENEEGEEEPVYILIDDDGEEEELFSEVVPATRRQSEKKNYNLVKNGGFENV